MLLPDKSNLLQHQIITAVAAMDVGTLENIIPTEVSLDGRMGNDRATFFKMLRDKFKAVRKRGVKQYKVSTSFCNNCYDNKEVIRFTESYGSGFALAFETQDSALTAIKICHSSGIRKEDLEEKSHSTFSYF